jgi:hypothetical protein
LSNNNENATVSILPNFFASKQALTAPRQQRQAIRTQQIFAGRRNPAPASTWLILASRADPGPGQGAQSGVALLFFFKKPGIYLT